METCLDKAARAQSETLARFNQDLPDALLFHQDRQKWAWACLLFPADDHATARFMRSLNDNNHSADIEDFNEPYLAETATDSRKILTQRMFRLVHLTKVLNHCAGRVDHYLSQCSFKKPERKVANSSQLTSAWVDLDIYNDLEYRLSTDKELVSQVLDACNFGRNDSTFYPTQIIRSGRGLYVKWVFNSFVPTFALPRWKLVQHRLVSDFFKRLCADPKATDAARVLRVVGSVNGKNQDPVRVIYDGETCNFDDLAASILIQDRMSQSDRNAVKLLTEKYQIDKEKKQNSSRPKKWNGNGRTWANLVAQELPIIIETFGPGDGMRGRMESLTFIVMNYRMMADLVGSESNFFDQVEELGKRMEADVELLKSSVKNLWIRNQLGETSYRLSKEQIRIRLDLDPVANANIFQQIPWLLDRQAVAKHGTNIAKQRASHDPARVQLLIDSGMQLKQVADLLKISTKTAKKLLVQSSKNHT